MKENIALLRGAVVHEWRRFRTSPVWMLGLAAIVGLAVSETNSSKVLGYPSANESLYGFQLACSMLLGLVAFLLASGSVAADLEGSRQDLVLSRAAPRWVYVAGKCLGAFTFSLALGLVVMLLCIAAPVWHGTLRIHDVRPFLLVVVLCVIPMLLYVCAMGVFLTVILRAAVITVPVMLVYFFAAALLNPSAPGQVSLLDFSHRLYPRELLIEVPLRLSEYTFSGLLDPIAGVLVKRALLYAGLALVLFVAAERLLGSSMHTKLSRLISGWWTWFARKAMPEVKQWEGKRPACRPLSIIKSADLSRDVHSATPGSMFLNELRLLLYSGKLMAGRNIVAVSLISVGLLLTVVTYNVGPFQTREGVLLFQLEMFAPLLGIAMFSDLVAAEFEARRADLLRASSRGAAWLLFRRLLHATLFTGAACLFLLALLRVTYTRFDLWLALGAIVPGALFFGTIALVAAAAARRSLVGYAVGTGAMILGLTLEKIEPLTPVSFHLREHLANSSLLGEYNWLLAKLVFLGLAFALGAGVLRLAKNPGAGRTVLAASAACVFGTFIGLHWLWATPVRMTDSQNGSRELTVIETNGVRWIRRADTAVRGRDPHALPSAVLVDVRSVRKQAGWQVERETPVDLTRDFELRHLELDASVEPATAAIDAEARFVMKVLTGPTDRLLFYLGAELDILQMVVGERPAAFTKSGNLVEVKLEEPAQVGDEPVVRVYYSGRLRLPQNLRYERSSKDLLFVTTRFFPSLRSAESVSRNLFTCRATIRTPTTCRVAAAEFIKVEGGENVFLWETRVPVDNVPLFVGTFREYRGQHEKTPISFCAFTADADYAKTTLVLAAQILEEFERAFGPYPFRRLAIVENRFQSAGGAAFPGLVTIKPERLAPEHQQRFLDGYLPHEIAHCWWGGGFPPWIAEGAAVFANAWFLDRHRGPAIARELMEKEFRQPFLSPTVTPAPLVGAQGITAYSKGGYLFLMLQRLSGEPTLLEAMRDFLEEHASDPRLDLELGSSRMIQHLKRATPMEWHPFIQDWTQGIERFDPELVSVSQKPVGTGFDVELQLRHGGKVRFPVPARVTLRSGKTQDVTWSCTNETGSVRIGTTEPVAFVELDPNQQLLDWDRSNNRLAPGEQRHQLHSAAEDRFVGWKTYTTTDGLPGTDVRCFALGSNRTVFAGISSFEAAVNRRWAVAGYDDGWHRYEPKAEPVLFVNAISWSRDGSFWLAGQNHLKRMQQDDSTDWMTGEIGFGGRVGQRRFGPNPSGNAGLPGFFIYTLRHDRAGRLWIGTDHGLACFKPDGTNQSAFVPVPALAGTEVFALTEDATGTMWAGTARGLFSNTGDSWDPQPGFPRELVLSVTAGPADVVWCGTYRSGIIRVESNSARVYSHRNSPIPDTIFGCVAAGPGGDLWAGTPDGLLHFDGQSWTRFTRTNSGLPSHHIRCLLADDRGRIWIGTDAGVTVYEPQAHLPLPAES